MAIVPCRILVVDDHCDSSTFLARLLRLEGHFVATAGSIAGAQRLCQESSFDIVISDIGLPDGSGCDLMRHLQKCYRMRGIALSGRGMPEDIAASEEAGFEAHLVKPISLHDVSAAIARINCGDTAEQQNRR